VKDLFSPSSWMIENSWVVVYEVFSVKAGGVSTKSTNSSLIDLLKINNQRRNNNRQRTQIIETKKREDRKKECCEAVIVSLLRRKK